MANDGGVVGRISSEVGFRLSAEGVARAMRPPPDLPVPGVQTVNAQGLIAGASDDSASRPVVWDARDGATDLAPKLPRFGLPYLYGGAYAVNDRGQVAGSYVLDESDQSGTKHRWVVFVWDARTDALTVVDSGSRLIAYTSTIPITLGIDDAGGVVTSFQSELGGAHGPPSNAVDELIVRWVPQADGSYQRKVLGPGTFIAVNAGGDILGNPAASASGRGGRPAVWRSGSPVPNPLSTPPGWTPSSTFSYSATDINARGEIVGTYTNLGNEQRALLWSDFGSTTPQLLETDGNQRTYADEIADTGAILGHTLIAAQPPATPAEVLDSTRLLLWDPDSRN
jgi:uncharacterized membrane protein